MRIIVLLLLMFSLTGCYTVLWLPSDEMPKAHYQNEFYNDEYYGEYYHYYDMPWWIVNPINIYYPSKSISSKIERDKNPNNIRNETGERIINERGGTGRIDYIPPTTTITGNNQGNNNSNNNNSNTNSSNEEQSRSRSNSSSDSNSIRNENGNRNSGNSRR